MKRRPGVRQPLLVLVALGLAACATPSWQTALRDAPARPLVEQAELAFIAGKDAAKAADLAERVLAASRPGSDEEARAFFVLASASDALATFERPLPYFARVLDAARDPEIAERIATQADRAWARLDGESAASPDVRAALERLAERPGDAWAPARSAALRELVTAERLRAGPLAAKEAMRRAGYLLDWRLSAPWGEAQALDFDDTLGPETRPLEPDERTGAGWDLIPIRTERQEFSDGEVTFFDLPSSGGVGFAETTIGAPGDPPRRVLLRLEANRTTAVFVGGERVLERRSSRAPWLATTEVSLAAGPQRLTVKLASADGKGFFRVEVAPLGQGSALPARALRVPHAGDARAAVLALLDLEEMLSRPRWDPDGARAGVKALDASFGPHTSLDLLAARLALGDASAPAAERRQLARRRFESVLARSPDHPAARRGIARIEVEEERPERALALLRDGSDVRSQLDLLDLLRERGWEAEALALADSLSPKAPASPRLMQELIDLYRAFGRVSRASALAEELERRFPGAGAERLAALLADRGTPRPELELARFDAEPQRHDALRSAIAALRTLGDDGALALAAERLAAFLADRPQDGWALGERVRLALQAGDASKAKDGIRQALAIHPDFAPLEALLAQLDGTSERFDEIEDGRQVLARWHAFASSSEGASWGEYPIVQVLERSAIEVRADGSTLELTHRVRLAQTKQGADALGDVRPPDGARLLVVRTLKADGRVLEPERTEGKADLSFSELQPGDAVETAWVTRGRVAPSEGGYLTGVSFASWGAPIFRLDTAVTMARGLALAVTSFGGAPLARREPLADGRQRWFWRIDRLPPVAREPLSISARSFFPFADLRVVKSGDAADAWDRIVRAYRSRLVTLGEVGPRLEALARTLVKKDPAHPEDAAFDWVKTEVTDQEQLNSFETPAEAAVASKKGNRALVLWALLRAMRRDPEILLCAPERDGPPEDRAAPTPNANRFFYPVIRVGAGGRERYFDPSRPYTPPDDLPAELGGAACLAPREGAARFVDLPVREAPPTFESELRLTLDEQGNARGTLSGLARGAAASPLKQAFIAQDAQRQRIIFEQWLASLAVGARLIGYEVHDAASSTSPMRWSLQIELPGYAQADGQDLVVQHPLKPLVHADFAGVPELAQLVSTPARTTPLRLLPFSEKVTLELAFPPSRRLVAPPPAIALRGLAQEVSLQGSTLVVTRRAVIRPGRVTSSEYDSFRRDVGAVIRAMESALRLERR